MKTSHWCGTLMKYNCQTFEKEVGNILKVEDIHRDFLLEGNTWKTNHTKIIPTKKIWYLFLNTVKATKQLGKIWYFLNPKCKASLET